MRLDASHKTFPRSRAGRLVAAAALPALLTVLVAAQPVSPSDAPAKSERGPSGLEGTVDPGIAPGDDFFAYANGAWLKATAIPAGKERWSGRDEIEAETRLRIAALLDAAGAAPAGSATRKVADFHAAYLDQAAIEARGLTSLKPLLDRIEKVSDKAELTRLLGRGLRADVDPMGFGIYNSAAVLGLSVEQSIHGEKTNIAFLVQGGLGLPDREDYLGTDPGKEALRARYRDYIRTMLTLAGLDRADQRAGAVLALETAIAQSHATREASANDHNADNVWTRSDFAQRAPGLDWTVFFDSAGLARQGEFVVWQPTAVTGLAALVASQPLEAWKDYLRFHAIHDFADVLPRAFAEQALALRAATGAGTPPSRAERALAATQAAMRNTLGRMYAERYFPAAQKARVERISDNVRAALIKRVEAATWMSAATRASALAKVQTLYVGIGYPDQWEDDSSLTVDPADPLGNLRRVSDRAYRNAVARLGQPVNLKYWYISPQTVGALLVFQQNAYVMSAALLEPPKYDHASSDAAAYGSVGALIGHDLTHYIDVLGADYDTEHRMRHWWTPEDTAALPGARAAARGSVRGVPAASRPLDQRQADAHGEHRRPRRPRRGVRRLPQDARQPGDGCGRRAGAGPGVLHRLRADASAQDQRDGPANAGGDQRPRAGGVPSRHGSQSRCVVRRVRRAPGAAAVPRALGARAGLVDVDLEPRILHHARHRL